MKVKGYDDLGIGDTIRQNHDGCPAGTDERQRQYITRPESDPTKLIWYCHNCGNGGLMMDSTYQNYREDRFSAFVSHDPLSGPVEEPPGLISDMAMWPTDAKSWAYRRGLEQNLVEKYEIKHDPSTNSIYLPRYTCFTDKGALEYNGYQLRSLYNGHKKYITVLEPEAQTWSTLGSPACGSAVVVEDLVSAIRIHSATGQSCVILYGVRCEPTVMYELANCYSEVFVWLDNDNDFVTRTASTIAKTVNFYDPSVDVHVVPFEYQDAKHYNDNEIREILNGFNR